MRSVQAIADALIILVFCISATGNSGQAQMSPHRIVIATGTVFDGKGQVLSNARIVIEGEKIVRIEPMVGPNTGSVDYDLRGLTVMPGWIDAHVHIAWIFGKDGKNGGAGWTPEET